MIASFGITEFLLLKNLSYEKDNDQRHIQLTFLYDHYSNFERLFIGKDFFSIFLIFSYVFTSLSSREFK
uniref:Uncharacterized protein n=1 Tax=Strongyloides stercoralis TaxID=6248 RepID=A0A0K0ENB9_STRER